MSVKIKNIKYIGKVEQQCITVSAEDGLYVTEDNVVTHNSALQFEGNVNYKIITGPGSILGQTIIAAAISELTVFVDEGWSEEKIYKFFTKLRERIDSRMNGNYYGRFILDSQPNTLESVIDDWIWNDAPKNKSNFIISGSRWKYRPYEFPNAWEDNRDYWTQPEHIKHDFVNGFPIFKGGNGMPPKVLESAGEVAQYDDIDVIWAPTTQITPSGTKSYKAAAEENVIEFLRDQAGIPSGAADRIFYNPATIEKCFDNNLKNMFGQITAPAEEEPEHLIWNQIKDKFFHKVVDKYYYYYEPGVPRAVSVDQSYAGDVTSIAMTHVERDPERKDDVTGEPLKVYVTDFIITIIPKGGIINLDAIRCFIWDLISLGNLKIKHASFDGFMSQPSIQFLKRKGVLVDQLSVDKTNEPYLNFIDYVFHGRWNTGRCIYAKNNMKSIQMVKRKQSGTTKIDHMNGDIVTDGDGNWETDQRGVNAKDSLDAVCGSIELINRYDNEFIPFIEWKPHALNDRSYETMKKKQDEFMAKSNFII